MRHACGDFCSIVQGRSKIWKFNFLPYLYEGYGRFHLQMVSNDARNLDYIWETIPFIGIGSNLKESYWFKYSFQRRSIIRMFDSID
jgi:hypothetical protein